MDGQLALTRILRNSLASPVFSSPFLPSPGILLGNISGCLDGPTFHPNLHSLEAQGCSIRENEVFSQGSPEDRRILSHITFSSTFSQFPVPSVTIRFDSVTNPSGANASTTKTQIGSEICWRSLPVLAGYCSETLLGS